MDRDKLINYILRAVEVRVSVQRAHRFPMLGANLTRHFRARHLAHHLPRSPPRSRLTTSSPLRFLAHSQCLFAIVSFATLADFGGSGSKYGYVLFTGISTLILTLGFMACYLFNAEQSKLFRTFELFVNLIWLVFWFAAAIVTSTFNQGFSQLAASCAFAWLTFIVWIVSCVMSAMAMRGRVTMPAAPQTASV